MSTQGGFRDIYVHQEGNSTIFCYRTGLTVYEEVYRDHRYMSAGWNTAGYTLNVLDDFPTRLDNDLFAEPQSFDIEADGVSLGWDWEYAGFEKATEELENGAEVLHGTVTLTSRTKPVTVRVHTLLDGTAVFTRWLDVISTADGPMNISDVAPICGGLETIKGWRSYMQGAPDCERIYSLGHMDSAVWGHEGYFRWRALPNMTCATTGKYYGGGRHRHPMFLLRNNLLGNIMIAQFGWTGGHRFEFSLDADGPDDCSLAYRIAMDSQRPMLVLDPGECFETPHVHIGMLHGDLDDAVNAMHAHLRRSVFTLPDARGVKGWVEGGMGPERLMDVRATKHFADTMASVGAETMIIDAGWYCPLGTECKQWHPRSGDWYPDPQRYPNGIAEIRDYIHSKGLLFGLWLDLERIGSSSRAAQEHPDWLSRCYAEEKSASNSQLNMADPEVAAWAESELARVIEEYKIDLFRLDYNLDMPHLLNRIDRGHGPENAYVRYYMNVNAMYVRLRKRFPDVVFENCAGGGGRTDVSFVTNFTHTWVSDWNVAPRSFAITNGMTMALPPELVDRLCGGMNCHTMGDLRFQVRNTIFGRPTTNDYNAVGSDTNPQQHDIVRHALDIYKRHIRPYIADSLIFHHTPEAAMGRGGAGGVVDQPQGLGVIERASGDRRHSVLGIFNLADSGSDEAHTIRPRGLNAALQYRVTLDNSGASFVRSGYDLMTDGLRVRLSASLSSELVVFEACD